MAHERLCQGDKMKSSKGLNVAALEWERSVVFSFCRRNERIGLRTRDRE